MKWHDGDISSAISKCKIDNAVLVVYIKGADDSSESMDGVWADPEITNIFEDRLCVCLQLPEDSVGGQQFSQIYPVTEVPSTYFISANGTTLEVIQGLCSDEVLKEKATNLISQRPTTPQGASSHPAGSETARSEGDGTESADPSLSAEENAARVERARELIRIKQQQKSEEEKEKARNVEIERRRLGQDLNKLNEFKADKEAKETRDALRKEKEETRLAREKIREQIQQDREERNTKYVKEKAEKAKELERKQQEKLSREAEEAARIVIANSSNARIQFRLPDGSKLVHTFEADDALQSARDMLSVHSANPLGRDFRLATIYPRRVFTPEDSQSSYRDLQLVPTSALLVLPPAVGGESVRPVANGTSSIMAMLNMIFAPFLMVWNGVWSFLFATPRNAPAQNQEPRQPEDGADRPQSRPEESSGGAQRRVGRLSDLPPGEDDQNTWNGNSTQQM